MTEDAEITEGNGSHMDALRHQIAKRRWREELRGVEYAGIRWHADAQGRQAVMESMQFASMAEAQGSPFSTQWKGKGGKWAAGIGKAELETVAVLLGQRRGALFAREKELIDQAEADPENFDERLIGTGWPD